MDNQLFEQAKSDDILSKELISFLLETMEYNSLSFINDAIEILKVLKIRIERGDKITDEVSKQIYEKKNFEAFVKKHFSEYISLVYMIATHIVYIKNVRTKTYSPFISANGKYCRYDESIGKIIEI